MINRVIFLSILSFSIMLFGETNLSFGETKFINEEKGIENDKVFYGLKGNVYYVSESGNDKNDGRTENLAFKTLQHASDHTKPGDIVYVMNGLYQNEKDEDILGIKRSGTESNWIMYAALPGHKPRLKVKAGDAISVYGADYLIIQGFELEGNNADVTLEYALAQQEVLQDKVTNSSGVSVHQIWDTTEFPHHIIVRNNHVHHFSGGGVAAQSTDYLLIENNIVHHNGYYGPWGFSGISILKNWNFDNYRGYKMIVRNNSSYANRNYVPFFYSNIDPDKRRITDGNGIIIDYFRESITIVDGKKTLIPYIGRTLIENNVSYFNGGRGINILKSDHVDVINNTTYQNSQTENSTGDISLTETDHVNLYNNILYPKKNAHSIFVSQAGSSVNIDYNLIYNTKKNSFPIANNIIGLDPLFVNIDSEVERYDFRLQPGSPAIDNGYERFAARVDGDGIARPVNKKFDIGAFEFTSQNTVGGNTQKNLPPDAPRDVRIKQN